MKYSILTNHIGIQGWMVEELGLRGNKLIVFAIIWGFTGNTKATNLLPEWSVNYRYLEAWTGLGECMIDRILQELQADNLIVWTDVNTVFVNDDYKV